MANSQFQCPYCGSSTATVNSENDRYFVACPDCAARGPGLATADAAVERWLQCEQARKAILVCEQRMRQAIERADKANRSKSTFLANMSHEVRTPMNAIVGLAELALRQTNDDLERDYLNKIIQASQSLLDVVNDILDISKIESDQLALRRENFQLADVLNRLAIVMTAKAAEKGLELRIYQSPESAELTLNGDPGRIGQVLLNLTANAIKFTEHGGITIKVEFADAGPQAVMLRCAVEDTGIGIQPEDCSRIFTAFEQADDSMTRKYGGTGLGLAICKRLLQMMGGEIGVDSQPGAGSRFWFAVRLAKAVEAAAPAYTEPGQHVDAALKERFAGRRILLAEDEPMNQLVLRLNLEQVGLVVDVAADGRIAIDMAAQSHYDLILMDLQMPNMNGIDATKAIRLLPGYATTPIVAVTANAFEEDRKSCLEAGMNDHLSKPVHARTLYETALKWLSAAA